MSLRGRLFVSYGLLLLIALSLTGVFIVARDREQWRRFLEDQNLSLASFTSTDLVRRFGTLYRGDDPSRQRQFTDQLTQLFAYNRDLTELTIIRRGEILFQARRSGDGASVVPLPRPVAVDDPLVARALLSGRRETKSYKEGGRTLNEIVSPAFGEGGGGAMAIRYRFGDETLRRHTADLLGTLAWIGLLVAASGLLAAATLARRIAAPLKGLVPLTEKVAAGDYSVRLGYRSRDEIGALVEAFDRMAERLDDSRRTLDTLNDQLARSEKLATVGGLAAGLSHELDNPLGAIRGFSERLRDSFAEGDPRREEAGIILEEALRCRRLIGSLLDYSRGGPRSKSIAPLAALAESAATLLRANRDYDGVDVSLEIPEDLPPLLVDPDRFRQVLVNLAVNACQAMPSGGILSIRAGAAAGAGELPPGALAAASGKLPPAPFVWVEIADTGTGISGEVRDRVFEPLFSTKAAGQGTGLGLSICQKIIEEEEAGRIVFADHEGGGTSFFIILTQEDAS
jgi:signal transduction histidine kinase